MYRLSNLLRFEICLRNVSWPRGRSELLHHRSEADLTMRTPYVAAAGMGNLGAVCGLDGVSGRYLW